METEKIVAAILAAVTLGTGGADPKVAVARYRAVLKLLAERPPG